MNAKRLIASFIFLAIVIAGSLVARHLILGSAPYARLQTASPLAAYVAPSLVTGSGYMPQEGKDFNITGTHYYDDKRWVVVSINSTGKSNRAFLVLQKMNGTYAVVLGPGSSFPSDVTQNLPPDVAEYLSSNRLIY